MNSRRRIFFALLVGAVAVISGCRKSAPNNTTTTPQAAPAPAPTASAAPVPEERHHGMFTSGVSPLIVNMSPETIPVHDGHAPLGRYSLTYEITNSEKVSKAYISVRSLGVGELQRFEVDVQPRATIEFFLDPSNVDLGPIVRFRAHCPYGVTDWFIMGSDAMGYPQNTSSEQIVNVSPSYVEAGRNPREGAFPVEIRGPRITRDCIAEAQVDGNAVELKNAVAGDKKISGLLSYSDLQGRPVVVRHLEVNLVVNGPGMPAEDTYDLKFAE